MRSPSVVDAAPAAWWRAEEDGAVRCELCPHRCRIAPGKQGICGVRENRDGALFTLTYGKAAALHLDPIEKKPLFHFHPGREILSLGSVGCNFHCRFCQNAALVLKQAPVSPVGISELVRAAKESGSVGLSYTYNEPLINFEFLRDCAFAFRAAGMVNVLVTNGYINPDPLRELLPLVDAMNIDLKSMNPAFYRKLCGGELEPVLETIRASARATHVEVTNLLVTGENDSDDEIRKVVDFVAEVDPEIPTHFSRYFPAHRFDAPPTPPERLDAALALARGKLAFVYVGNYHLAGAEDTRCPRCGKTAVRRAGYRTTVVGLKGARCGSCGSALRFVV
ncbi:MAG: AmmeMemoRadiSam system radical SAM enzyme [Deltaproteobacteria bacterium]|nr:AmmeMemoRadiSam system radical SAM enzyme [Deltaproteobacteria bacterium]